jgi:hypothetical protein
MRRVKTIPAGEAQFFPRAVPNCGIPATGSKD